ncbi:UDP-glucose:(heptosyl)LPS alpha-1,3-glucosyltransferase [Microbacterium sp. cf046]|uniref:glycosyltransferase family 4 protein n=1 Tax=Microbacterium sp. cf046 TaxID=1761803 RepID=UPI0008E44CB2|nr:glycosyltransferase family 4 protein [Microbacterium sp. cf046]SFR91023.1 UDP-glucose:(heptosyl)LPS alpha-1,3-glucosyltransferase [Microbacterium sp. cf046]
MTHIVQIAPYIGRGSGVAGVAWNLQTELAAMGHTVESFTVATAQRRPTRGWPKHPLMRAFALFRRMVWFTTVGTVRARRFLAERPDAVAICHNNVMTGDIYVNHGVVGAAMRARGNGLWRMIRNPTHIFTYVRDSIRYRSGLHRAVVALSRSEADTLRRVYGRVRSRIVVIPNGVDLDAYRPPTPEARRRARADFHLDDDQRVVLFIGHEFSRKGLDQTIEALVFAPSVLLLVVGGNAQAIDAARARADVLGVAERVLFVGTRTDLPLFFAAADIFVLASAYEANALVVLEALASGLPVVSTPVGYAPELIVDGDNGYLVARDAREIGARFEDLADADLAEWGVRARRSVEHLGWRPIAERYLALVDEIIAERAATGAEA